MMTSEHTKRCPFCAETIYAEAIKCRFCGEMLNQTGPQYAHASYTYPHISQRQWSPGAAAVLSLFIPGVGQIYKGQLGAGFAWLIGVPLGYLCLAIPGLVLHIICVYNAYSGAPSMARMPITGPIQSFEVPKQNEGALWTAALVALSVLVVATIGIFGYLIYYSGASNRTDAKAEVASALPAAPVPAAPQAQPSQVGSPVPTATRPLGFIVQTSPSPAPSSQPLTQRTFESEKSAAPVVAFPSPPKENGFEKWKSGQVLQAFSAAGLEVAVPRVVDVRAGGLLLPKTMNEGMQFSAPSLCSDCNGQIYTFASQAGLDQVRSYYGSLGKPGEPFFSWLFVRDNVLVRINGKVPEAKARRYDEVLNAMK